MNSSFIKEAWSMDGKAEGWNLLRIGMFGNPTISIGCILVGLC